MITALEMINYTLVTAFGIILSFEMLGCTIKRYWKHELMFIVVVELLQLLCVQRLSVNMMFKLYPLMVHIPLALFLRLYEKMPFFRSLTAVMVSYLCCEPRRWIGVCCAVLSGGNEVIKYLVEIIVTVPFLLFLLFRVSPHMAHIIENSNRKLLIVFAMLPYAYYLMDYGANVYTERTGQEIDGFLGFLPSVMSVMYLLFVVLYVHESTIRMELEMNNQYLNIANESAQLTLKHLYENREMDKVFRHDMRHHLNILQAYLEEERVTDAISYIENMDQKLKSLRSVSYCENITINLLLTHFVREAADRGILMEAEAKVPESVEQSANDICTILANALENAIHGCEKVRDQGDGQPQKIKVRINEKDQKLLLYIQNPCVLDVPFRDGYPYTEEPGHGMGVRSILLTLEKLGGFCSYENREGSMTFRAML